MKKNNELVQKTEVQIQNNEVLRSRLTELLQNFGPNWHIHTIVGLKVQTLARILYYSDLYKSIVHTPGVICEFGVQWGSTMAALTNLRSIYEPFNISRKIIGFDTFQGFPSVSKYDTTNHLNNQWKIGDYSTIDSYEEELDEILKLHEENSPMPHIKKHELIKGDISITFEKWLKENPHAIISMAIFDTDLYTPTRDVLKLITERLTKGSILVFDELNCEHFPGETIALREVLGLNNLKLRRSTLQPYCSWAVWGE